MEPSTTDQSLPVPFWRYECHPFRSCPSNNNCHPSCFSCGVSAFDSCADAMPVNKRQTAAAIDNFLRFIITILQTSMPAQRVSLKEPALRGRQPANISPDFYTDQSPRPSPPEAWSHQWFSI